MRKSLFIILLAGIFFSQTSAQSKTQRRIYLWDVTLSVKGFGGAPDIYDDVVAFLEKDINSLTDENTEIMVLPFQQRILEEWKVRATEQGKKEIIQKIKDYDNENLSLTNIYVPLLDVKDSFITNDKYTLLFLLTDGVHNDTERYSKNDLLKLLDSLCGYLKSEDAYAFYIMLTKNAIDNDIVNIINNCKNMEYVTPSDTLREFIELQPSELVKYNIRDSIRDSVRVSLVCKKNIAIPEGIKVSITSYDDSILNVNETVELQNHSLPLSLSFYLKYDSPILQNTLPVKTRIPLKLEVLNKQEIKDNTGKIISLNPADIELELINTPEKTLKINVKK